MNIVKYQIYQYDTYNTYALIISMTTSLMYNEQPLIEVLKILPLVNGIKPLLFSTVHVG